MNSMNKPTPDICDMVTLGERGQVVIPQAVRERAGLKPGDKLMVVFKDGPMIGLVPPAAMRSWVTRLTSQLSAMDNDPAELNSSKGD